jgi:adenosylhomocysteine nucleosidase
MFGRFRSMILLVLILSLVACASARSEKAPAPGGDGGVDVVVQGAVDSELQPLLAALEGRQTIQIAAWTFWRGRIGAKDVVVSRTEVGPINAVAATTLAIERFRPRLVLNQGTAGATDPDLRVFDIIIGDGSVDYGAFRSAPRGAGAGVDLSGWRPMPHRLRLDGGERVAFPVFAGDARALQVALETPYARGRLVKGVIGSAFEFNLEIDRLAWIRRTHGAVSEDMESAFAAGTAAGFGTPFLAIRIISDSEFRAAEFQPIAGEHCAAFVLDVLKRLARTPTPALPAAALPLPPG